MTASVSSEPTSNVGLLTCDEDPHSLDELQALIDCNLKSLQFTNEPMATGLEEAMRYALLAGGKRIRPLLALSTANAISIELTQVLPFAMAVEMVHTYSLIHDDLPAMDDDDLRRGLPTCHKKYGEAVAILAGDALFAEAFSLLLQKQQGRPQDILVAVREFARATGADGMVAGQYIDVTGGVDRQAQNAPEKLQRLHELKTGCLIRASVECVILLAGETYHELLPTFRTYATELGLLFQIVDDILDVTGTSISLGKPAGSDERHDRLTYVAHYGLEQTRSLAAKSHQRAHAALRETGLGSMTAGLEQLTDIIYSRSS